MLVVRAAEDRIAPEADAADELLAAYPDRVRVVIAEPAGHAIPPEQSGLIGSSVLDFLTEVHPVNRQELTR